MKRLERTIPILLMLTILLCSCSKSQGAQWQEQYDLGVRYLSEGNYEEAIIAFTAAIEIDPNRVDAYIGLADTYLVIGDYVSAAAVWDTTQITDAELLSTFANQSDRYSEIQAELESGEPGVWITSLSFDQESFLAGEETAFYVMALYRTPENGNFQMQVSANVEEPEMWQWQGEDTEIPGGIGVQQVVVRLTPARWEGPYFGLQVGIWQVSGDQNWDWIDGDTWYITPDGEVSYHYAPLNTYGATEFVYRRDYKEFSTLDSSIQNRVETIAEAVLSDDQDYLLSLLDTGTGFNDHFFTIWNGYKIEISDDAEWNNKDYDVEQATDRYKSFQIEMRPENGTGYYCHVSRSETTNTTGKDSWLDWSDSVDLFTCPCVDWQWYGNVSATEYDDYYWRNFEGTTCHTVQTTTAFGTMVDGLWDGTATSTMREVSDWSPGGPDDSDETTTTTRVFQDGVLVEENGEPWDGGQGYHLIGYGYHSGGFIYHDEQFFLDNRYW